MSGLICAVGVALFFSQAYYAATAPEAFAWKKALGVLGLMALGFGMFAAGVGMWAKGV